MKKYIISLVVLGVLIAPSLVSASIDVNLKYGARGSEVIELQEFLIDKGLLASTATGNFYSLTRKAVIAYQTSVNVPATGFVGPLTRAKINEELSTLDSVGATAELDEVGTTTSAVVSPSTDALLLQNQINLLRQQIDAQIALQTQMLQDSQTQNQNLQTQLTNTNTQLQQVVTNTAPTPTVTPPPPVVVVEPLKIKSIQYYFLGTMPTLGLITNKQIDFSKTEIYKGSPNLDACSPITQNDGKIGYLCDGSKLINGDTQVYIDKIPVTLIIKENGTVGNWSGINDKVYIYSASIPGLDQHADIIDGEFRNIKVKVFGQDGETSKQ